MTFAGNSARLLVSLAATLTSVSAWAAPAAPFGALQPQRQMMHDPRDLTPGVRQFPDTYTGGPIESPVADAKARKSTNVKGTTTGGSVSTTTAPPPPKRTAIDDFDVYYGF